MHRRMRGRTSTHAPSARRKRAARSLMPISVAAPPQRVPVFSGFDYVTIDEARHRAYAAHTASKRLLIVDTSDGKVSGQVDVGPMHGLAVDPATGDVFTGNGTDQTLSKGDPQTMKVLASVTVPGNIDAIAYDPSRKRVYADQDGGGSVYVIDGAAMKLVATIAMPADDLESPAVDPKTGTLYQNLANGGGFAVVDPATPKVVNGVLSAYAPSGTHVGDANVQPHIDQCSTGSRGDLVVCAGRGIVTVISARSGAAPRVLGRFDTGQHGLHTAGVDESTGDIWVVYSDPRGDWVQRLRWTP